jgi:hypothetical protein
MKMFITDILEEEDDLIILDEDTEVDIESWWRDVGGEG